LCVVGETGFCFPLLATSNNIDDDRARGGANFLLDAGCWMLDACRRDLYFVFLLSRQLISLFRQIY
jgi:hypothetical protein